MDKVKLMHFLKSVFKTYDANSIFEDIDKKLLLIEDHYEKLTFLNQESVRYLGSIPPLTPGGQMTFDRFVETRRNVIKQALQLEMEIPGVPRETKSEPKPKNLTYKQIALLCWFKKIYPDSIEGKDIFKEFGDTKTNMKELCAAYKEVAGKEGGKPKALLNVSWNGQARAHRTKDLEVCISILKGEEQAAAKEMLETLLSDIEITLNK